MDTPGRLIVPHAPWLTDRAVHYAQLHGHAACTSTLRETRRASVAQLRASLVATPADATPDGSPRLAACAAAATCCLEQPRRHRDRGIGLDMVPGLLAFDRRSNLDLVETHHATPADRRRMLVALMKVFDAIGLCLVRDIVDMQKLRHILMNLLSERPRPHGARQPAPRRGPDGAARQVPVAAALLGQRRRPRPAAGRDGPAVRGLHAIPPSGAGAGTARQRPWPCHLPRVRRVPGRQHPCRQAAPSLPSPGPAAGLTTVRARPALRIRGSRTPR